MLQGFSPSTDLTLKALQLLDYLMKHGSSRVVENAREHTYDLKALLKFRYIDEKGKDQGVNGNYFK